ncbi:MAG: TlpA family protein disulfide reductase [Proteobacteria bacterium]|nr:TlpA family protein disulfide reductase [Pseudomonadota bacterium]
MKEEETGQEVSTEEEGQKSNSTLPKMLMLGAMVLVFAFTILLLWGGRYELARIKPGYPAPDFTFPDLSGKQVSLSDYKGKFVLLNLWSITCPPCIEEVPYFEGLYQQMKGQSDFHLLTVVTNRGETEDKVRPFMEKHGLSFQALIDYKKVAWRRYKLTGWPETFLIGRDGKILEKYVGPREWDSPEFINKFNKLVEGP